MLRKKQVQIAARFARRRFAELHPYEVQAVLLNACNLKCAYCSCPELKTSVLSTRQWLDTIRRFGELGTLRLKWQGGEPTMRKDFDELCAAVQKAGILSAVVTNGMYIAENPSLLDHLDEVVFSLDSAVAEHTDRVRGPGVHAAVLKAIEVSLAHAKRPRLFINMVVLRDNLEQIDPMLRFCEERGIGLNAQPANFGMKYYDDGAKGIALSNEDTRAMYRQLAEWRRQGRPLMFGSGTYGRSALWPDYTVLSRRTEQGESSCAMGRFYIHIDANGDVHPCVQHSADFQPKNIGRHGLDEALRNAQHHNCNDCYGAYLNERKNLFGLRPASVWEYLRR